MDRGRSPYPSSNRSGVTRRRDQNPTQPVQPAQTDGSGFPNTTTIFEMDEDADLSSSLAHYQAPGSEPEYQYRFYTGGDQVDAHAQPACHLPTFQQMPDNSTAGQTGYRTAPLTLTSNLRTENYALAGPGTFQHSQNRRYNAQANFQQAQRIVCSLCRVEYNDNPVARNEHHRSCQGRQYRQ